MVRISGAVKTADSVRNRLHQGVNPQEMAALKEFVAKSLQTIEKICTKANTSPYKLPPRSRKAYHYLKTIDWSKISPRSHQVEQPAEVVQPSLRVKNIIKQQKNIQQEIAQLPTNYSSTQLTAIQTNINQTAESIDRICQKNQVTPAALTTPSRKAYAWLKFLSSLDYLRSHVATVQRIKTLLQQTIEARKLNVEFVEVAIANYNGLYKYKQHPQGNIELLLSEGFIEADDKILQAVVNMVLLDQNSQDKRLIRDFGTTEAYSEIILELDLIADVDAEITQGNHYDLELLFDRLNQVYFGGKMAKPRLTWNKTLTHRKLGHYEPLRDRVVMSRTLDSSHVPQMVVELVLYHELLHKHHCVKWLNERRMVHTPEFRRSEKEFKQYQAAQTWLEQSATF